MLSDTFKPGFDIAKLMQVLRVINCAYFNALFVGEEAVDAGGEYWQLIVQAVGSEYCCGMEGNMAID